MWKSSVIHLHISGHQTSLKCGRTTNEKEGVCDVSWPVYIFALSVNFKVGMASFYFNIGKMSSSPDVSFFFHLLTYEPGKNSSTSTVKKRRKFDLKMSNKRRTVDISTTQLYQKKVVGSKAVLEIRCQATQI